MRTGHKGTRSLQNYQILLGKDGQLQQDHIFEGKENTSKGIKR